MTSFFWRHFTLSRKKGFIFKIQSARLVLIVEKNQAIPVWVFGQEQIALWRILEYQDNNSKIHFLHVFERKKELLNYFYIQF